MKPQRQDTGQSSLKAIGYYIDICVRWKVIHFLRDIEVRNVAISQMTFTVMEGHQQRWPSIVCMRIPISAVTLNSPSGRLHYMYIGSKKWQQAYSTTSVAMNIAAKMCYIFPDIWSNHLYNYETDKSDNDIVIALCVVCDWSLSFLNTYFAFKSNCLIIHNARPSVDAAVRFTALFYKVSK